MTVGKVLPLRLRGNRGFPKNDRDPHDIFDDDKGLAVFGVARNAENVTALVKRLREEGLEVAGTTCDVSSTDEVREAVAAAVREYGRIDVLVNNAGRNGGGQTATMDDATWFDVIDTNLNSVFRVTREVLANGGTLDNGWGRVISIASTGQSGAP